ncbi:MAG: gluconate 2-dehydrogenase subunit 3 family protein [Campylobacterota bacterium]|nr:gluconate 2-dehydrogenase subunit 3 family protein [Campylobacterota bacterium]
MKRRKFLIIGSIVGLSCSLAGKNSRDAVLDKSLKSIEKTIQSVQEHLFPEGSKIPSAKSMNATQFLLETITHPTYDKDIRLFVIDGAEELKGREKGKFISYSGKEKERALRAYEETGYGSSWLSRIMTLTIEGIFSDPIYGSNVKEAGWKALGSYGGVPRPTVRYIEL